ncbi:hypothetical protein [Pseudomonas pohangensis]|uniref:hypothetical protein n=1 Tax=Pseudomonas pohangensis TaxID=364197 RepID=UPI0012FD2761|nr:hypothetical protein [Pseudomonas pohangensis]
MFISKAVATACWHVGNNPGIGIERIFKGDKESASNTTYSAVPKSSIRVANGRQDCATGKLQLVNCPSGSVFSRGNATENDVAGLS